MSDEKTSRRDFLGRSIGSCLAAPTLLGAAPQAARTGGAARLGWSLTLQSSTFRTLPFLDMADLCAEMHIRFIEGWPGQPVSEDYPDLKLDLNNAEAQKLVQEKLQIHRILFPAYGPVEVPAQEDAARRLLENCKKLGALVIVTESTPAEMHDKLCQETGLYIAIHNSPDSWPPEKVLEACKGRSRWIGACADTGSWARRGLDPVETLRKLKGRIVSLHLKDLTEDRKDAPWGAGKSDVKAQLMELKAQGFKGYISIELEGPPGKELEENVRRCAAFFTRTCDEICP